MGGGDITKTSLIYRAFGRRNAGRHLKHWTEAGIGLKPAIKGHKEKERK